MMTLGSMLGFRSNEKGQSVLEFLFWMPFMILVICMVIEGVNMYVNAIRVTNLAQELALSAHTHCLWGQTVAETDQCTNNTINDKYGFAKASLNNLDGRRIKMFLAVWEWDFTPTVPGGNEEKGGRVKQYNGNDILYERGELGTVTRNDRRYKVYPDFKIDGAIDPESGKPYGNVLRHRTQMTVGEVFYAYEPIFKWPLFSLFGIRLSSIILDGIGTRKNVYFDSAAY